MTQIQPNILLFARPGWNGGQGTWPASERRLQVASLPFGPTQAWFPARERSVRACELPPCQCEHPLAAILNNKVFSVLPHAMCLWEHVLISHVVNCIVECSYLGKRTVKWLQVGGVSWWGSLKLLLIGSPGWLHCCELLQKSLFINIYMIIWTSRIVESL